MKSVLLFLFLSFSSLNIGNACSCGTFLEFFDNTYVKDYGKNCIAVLDSFSYAVKNDNLPAETGHFTLLDTLSEMKVSLSLGQTILVYGQNGLNCGALIRNLAVGDTFLLSLYDGFIEETKNDTFYLDGCGTFYLNLNDPEYIDWTKAELQERINGITTNTQELSLAQFITLFPNPATQRIFIQSKKLAFQSIQVYDNSGKLLLNLDGLETDNQEIIVSQLQAGIYLMQINTLEGTTYKKFLKS